MNSVTLVFLLLIPISSFAHDWLKDDVQILCKDMKYDKRCKDGEDGWFSKSFVDKNSQELFGSYGHSEFGPFFRFNCGDHFEIKGQSLKCEEFVEKIRKKNQECNNCLKVEFDGGS